MLNLYEIPFCFILVPEHHGDEGDEADQNNDDQMMICLKLFNGTTGFSNQQSMLPHPLLPM